MVRAAAEAMVPAAKAAAARLLNACICSTYRKVRHSIPEIRYGPLTPSAHFALRVCEGVGAARAAYEKTPELLSFAAVENPKKRANCGSGRNATGGLHA